MVEYAPSGPAPTLDGTAESAERLTSWATSELALGNMDPRTADAFSNQARTHLASIRTRHGMNELEELRSLVERQEKAIQSISKQEQKDRYEASTGDSVVRFGRVRATPDGEPPH